MGIRKTVMSVCTAACSRMAIGAALAPGLAYAQAASAPGGESDASEAIVITAERRNSTAIETPITLTVLSAGQLQEIGATGVRDLYTVTPGLRLDQFGSNILPAIRGVSTTASGVGVSPNVAVYLDGFYLPNPASLNFEFPDIENVQVLKGPQGTLFGRNATGGAILMKTRDPGPTPEGQFTLGYGTYDEKVANAFVSGPLADRLYASVAASYRSTDGYTRNIVTGEKDGYYEGWYIRGKLRFEATDWLNFNLRAEHGAIDDPITWVFRNGAGNDLATALIPDAIITSERYKNSADIKTIGRKRLDGVYLSADADLGFATLSSYTGYQKEYNVNQFDFDGSDQALVNFRYDLDLKTFTQELILAGETGPLEWSTGAFLLAKNDKMPFMRINGATLLRDSVKTDAYALFADGTYNLVSDLFVTAGIRYSREKKEFKFGGATGPLLSTDKTWESWTPRFVLRYQFDNSTSAFASYAKGFAAGIYSAFTPALAPADPEKLDAFEVGFKHNRSGFSIDLSTFFYKYKDMQFVSYTTTETGVVSALRNVGRAETYGLEAAVSVDLTDSLTFRANGAYTHGEYKEFPGAVGYEPVPEGGWTTVPVDASGNQMLRTPRWSGNLSLVYKQPLAGGELQLGTNLFLTSKIYHDPANQFKISGYHLLDVNVSWTTGDGNWTFAVTGKNVTDKYYINYWDPTSAALLVNDGIPATVRGTITRRF